MWPEAGTPQRNRPRVTEMLEGITVLDLASVGPARARASRGGRWLADYGATVVKIGPVPKDEGVQIVPPFYAYSAHRRLQRALFNMKAPEGREAFLRLAERADVVIESFRPGVVDRLGIGWEATSARNPRLVYCATSDSGRPGPAPSGPGTTSTTSVSAGSSTAAGERPTASLRSPDSRWPTAPAAACTR